MRSPAPNGTPESVEAQRFRRLLIAGALACLPLVVAQVALAVLLAMSIVYVPLMYMPLFDSMTVVK